MSTVAVIGAGPGGLVAARYLKSEGFTPVVFDQVGRVGGQWAGDPHYSAIWPAMRTNTSRVMTAFSDRLHAAGTSVYPRNQVVTGYLESYAEQFDLHPHIHLNTRVESIDRDPNGRGWVVRVAGPGGDRREEVHSHVIVATGRQRKPSIPVVPGLASFSGRGGVAHTFDYNDPDRYRGQRVLVAGCSISALEVASDLAMLGAAHVATTNRRQRYVIHKLMAGVPADHLAFTRFGALAAESFPPEAVAATMKEFVLRTSGSPDQFGAPTPADNVFAAGITLSQHFLPLVAEGRIEVRPWIESVDGRRVRFIDGAEDEFDAILLGTGYQLDLPYLGDVIRRALDLDARHIDLHKLTFHPDLPGLAFLGQFDLVGPYFPLAELQARWIAYAWSGARPAPSVEEMRAGVSAYRARRGGSQLVLMHSTALMFAREAGVEPEAHKWPELARALLFGPLTAVSFRLTGRDSLPDAPERVAEASRAFGAIRDPAFTPDQLVQIQALAAARRDPAFAHFVDDLTAKGSAQSRAAGA